MTHAKELNANDAARVIMLRLIYHNNDFEHLENKFQFSSSKIKSNINENGVGC